MTNARGVFSRPIAEYVLMMILAVSRRLPQLLELQRERTWQPLEGRELRDVTVGIVGLGSIGRAVGGAGHGVRLPRRSRSAGDREARSPRQGSRGEGEDAPRSTTRCSTGSAGPRRCPSCLAESDFIVLAAPLTPETEDMIDEPTTLAMVKPGAWLINVARGRLIDERALLRALRDGPIGGAVLDTFRDEPLPALSSFYELPNVIVTPAHGVVERHGSSTAASTCSATTCAGSRPGEPLLNVVDPAAGY